MNKQQIDSVAKRASKWHNDHDFEDREKLCISSMSQQITTLRAQKIKIIRAHKSLLSEIDDHIENVARFLKQALDKAEAE